MRTPAELRTFLDQGWLHVPVVFDAAAVARLRTAFIACGGTAGGKVSQPDTLTQPVLVAMLDHEPLVGRIAAVFGDQAQLLSLDMLYQGPRSRGPARQWHRDFNAPGDWPLAINTITYLDDMTPDKGPTVVIPGSHRGLIWPPPEQAQEPLPGEIPIHACAGDVVFINAAIWHSGGRNCGDGERRALYAYFGWWWLKRYDLERRLPAQAFVGATTRRLRLLGIDQPQYDLHAFDRRGTVLDHLERQALAAAPEASPV